MFFVTNCLKMLTLFSSIGDLFKTSKTYSEKEQVGEKIELFWVLSNQTTTNINNVLLFFRTVVKMLISKSMIYPDCTSVEAPQLWDFFLEFFWGLSRTSKPLCSHKQLAVSIDLRRTESADCFDVLRPQKCHRSYRECAGFSIHFNLRTSSQSLFPAGFSFSGFCSKQKCFYRV